MFSRLKRIRMQSDFEDSRDERIAETMDHMDIFKQRALVQNFQKRRESFEAMSTTRERDRKRFVVRI